MKLIADSGSTKTDWCLIKNDGSKDFFITEGYNPFYVDVNYICNSIRNNFNGKIEISLITEVYFYGAGCQHDNVGIMQDTLAKIFTHANSVSVNDDLLAAAYALLDDQPGFVAILGTGSNSCLYDGKQIALNIDSLGFILGDEGSGASIGRQVIVDFLRQQMPRDVQQLFLKTYQVTAAELMNKVYNEPMPNRYCAGYAKFLSDPGISPEYARQLLCASFETFFVNLVTAYPDYNHYSFNCVGSIGYQFRDMITSVAATFNMPVGRIIPSVIHDLAEYHKNA
jgi:N-acetylglucosamine kinase-like BadF-type ATPase